MRELSTIQKREKLNTVYAVDEAGEQAVAAQQLNPGVGADEGRGKIADHNADVQPFAARDFILPRDVGNHQAQGGADESGHHGDAEGV